MKKKWFLTFLITILALPIFASNVFAETEVVYEDGTYDVPLVAKFGETVFDQFSETAKVKIEDGNQYIQFGHIQTNIILEVTIPNGEVEIITEDEENKTREVGFNYMGNLTEPVPFSINMVYGKTHNMHAHLDMSNVPVVAPVETEPEPEEETAEPEVEEPVEEEEVIEEDENKPGKNFIEFVNGADEEYSINFVSESRAVNGQFNNPTKLLYKDGKKYIQMSGTGGQFIEWLAINGTEVGWGEQNDDGSFIVQFELVGNLSDQLDFGMLINAGGREMEHEVDLTFDENTKQPIVEDKEKVDEVEEVEEVEEETDVKEEVEVPEAIGELVPDKASQIDYTILQDVVDAPSAADFFFEKPAILLEKDGERYIQITTTEGSGDFIKSLRAKLGDKYHEMVIVEKTNDGRTIFQFKVEGNLSDVILLDMIIDVAGIYNNQYHEARLILDPNSIRAVNASDYQLVASTNENGPDGVNAVTPEDVVEVTPGNNNENNDDTNGTTSGNSLDPNTPAKPELGETEKGDVLPQANQNGAGGNPLNPQTGENTNMMLYVLLLIGSAIPLAIKAKRRFA